MSDTQTTPSRAELIAKAAATPPAPDAEPCTGLTAKWCPKCGNCTCVEREVGGMDDERCPLHSPESKHAEAAPDAEREPDEPRTLFCGAAKPMLERDRLDPRNAPSALMGCAAVFAEPWWESAYRCGECGAWFHRSCLADHIAASGKCNLASRDTDVKAAYYEGVRDGIRDMADPELGKNPEAVDALLAERDTAWRAAIEGMRKPEPDLRHDDRPRYAAAGWNAALSALADRMGK